MNIKMIATLVFAGLLLLGGNVFAGSQDQKLSGSSAGTSEDKSSDSWDTNNYREAPETHGYHGSPNDSFDTNGFREAPEDGSRTPRGYYGSPEQDESDTNNNYYDPRIDVGTNSDKL